MVQDLLVAVGQILKRFYADTTMKWLKPTFTLAGSITEGTRLGYGNELDLGMKFESLVGGNVAFKVGDTPFSLMKARTCPRWMDEYFIPSTREFRLHKFKSVLLEATEKAVLDIFEKGDNPPRLKCIITNRDWRELQESNTPCGQCSLNQNGENASYKHCERHAVAVAQTKIGLTLQFLWAGNEHTDANDIYCSVDVIPEFHIMSIAAIKLANTVNVPMCTTEPIPPPVGCLDYMGNYDKHYKINLNQDGDIQHVVLKYMNFFEGRNHHVRPAQPSEEGREKFSSERMRMMYSYIKFIKKNVEGVELSSFWTKKELLKSQYEEILDSCKEKNGRGEVVDNNDCALVAILSQPEFRSKVEGSRIDLEKSNKEGFICFKN